MTGPGVVARGRRGFTLVELMIALVLLGVVMGTAVRFFRSLNTSVQKGGERLDALQNLRFAVSTIGREVRIAGAGAADAQPTLVYAGPAVVAFNADLVSRIAGSPTAVYYNPDALPNTVSAPPAARRFTLPGTTFSYPDTTYRTTGSQLSPAETIVFYVEADTATARSDDFVMWRQVNDAAPEVVARNLLAYPNAPFFEYLRTDAAGRLVPVATASLPWLHRAAVHGSIQDTGVSALTDSIRAMRLYLRATNGQSGAGEIRRQLVSTVRIPNAGLIQQRTCGDLPIFLSAVTAVFGGDPEAPTVEVRWAPAVDERAGERDVESYLVYRRLASDAAYSDPLASIPAGAASYEYTDASVQNGRQYVYAVSAFDCTPLESAASVSATVTIP